jgi:hypothetical protein
MLERYIIPLAPYAFTAVGCIFGLFLIVSFEKEIHRLKSRLARSQSGDDCSARELKHEIEQLNYRLRDAEERAGITAAPPIARASLNLNKRTQVLRMSRRGERAENIAASLSLPRREVELLLKIHGLVLNSEKTSAN